jgi:tetratricopeptide (TPR) repeat protein
MSFDEFLSAAWSDHADRPQEVADRLAASFHVLQSPAQVAPFANLLAHVNGEHLGHWQRGIELLQALRSVPAFDGNATTSGALDRHVATLRYASGDAAALAPLAAAERAAVLASSASIFAGRGQWKSGIAAYTEALAIAGAGLPANAPAIRALAVGGNNLAVALEGKTDRDAGETQGMIAAAQGALTYWRQAGTWLEEERAHYRLARTLIAAGDPAAAANSAQRCIDVCVGHDAPAFEAFFGWTALAVAQRALGEESKFAASRAHALALFEQIPQDEQAWCKPAIDELR